MRRRRRKNIFAFLFFYFPFPFSFFSFGMGRGGEGEVEELRWGARKPFYMGSQLGGNDRKSVSVRDSPIGCIRDDSDMFLFLFPFLSLSLSLYSSSWERKPKQRMTEKKSLQKCFNKSTLRSTLPSEPGGQLWQLTSPSLNQSPHGIVGKFQVQPAQYQEGRSSE